METSIREEEVQDMARKGLVRVKAIIIMVVPQMTEADVDTVLNAVKDLTYLAIRATTDEIEKALEELISIENTQAEGMWQP